MKHIFIINPISGTKKFNQYMNYIEETMNERKLEYEIILTQYVNHASKIASMYKKEDNVILYVFGGDGTVHEVINGIHPNVPMAIIPVGTGNDFYRYFQSDTSDIKKIINETIDGYNTKIDIGVVNDIKFINCFSMGFDAIVSDKADKMIRENNTSNKLAYLICALKELRNPDIMDLTITVDDNPTIKKNVLIMAIMNGRYYGGGFNPTPLAKINDNLLDYCAIEKLSKLRLVKLLPAYSKGTHTKAKEVTSEQFKKIHISSPVELTMEVDGEVFYSSEVDVNVLNDYLTLRLPKNIII